MKSSVLVDSRFCDKASTVTDTTVGHLLVNPLQVLRARGYSPPMRTMWGLQYLRAAAALTVLLFHAAVGNGDGHALGAGGVDIFFVVSGFLMFQITSLEPHPVKFASARLKRIIPTYWIVTLLVATFQSLQFSSHSTFSLIHLLRSLLFIPDLDVQRQGIYPVLVVGWTLNYEMFFYTIMTFALLIQERLRIVVVSAILISLILFREAVSSPSIITQFYGNPIIAEFAVGGVLSVLYRRRSGAPWEWVLVVFGALLMFSPQPTSLPRIVGYGIPAAMIVRGVLSIERGETVPYIRNLVYLGDASYSIYLWHLFVVTALYRSFGTAPPIFALAVIGGVLAGLASYRFIELPCSVLLRRVDMFRREVWTR